MFARSKALSLLLIFGGCSLPTDDVAVPTSHRIPDPVGIGVALSVVDPAAPPRSLIAVAIELPDGSGAGAVLVFEVVTKGWLPDFTPIRSS